MSEFDLIKRFFANRQSPDSGVALGIGDDCALMITRPGMHLAVSTDMLVQGRHFFPDADPFWLGHKALAVNLSDLAAMGAHPRGFTLALALPQADPVWLEQFSAGMFALANQADCPLIGGDTTAGPLNISITIMGDLPVGSAIRRAGARPGDEVWVSGTLGDARLALLALLGQVTLPAASLELCAPALHRPQPRLALGKALRGVASAAIDVSDGLAGDLGHILVQSGVGATLDCDLLPLGPVLASMDQHFATECALSGGDDYELCFCASPAEREHVLAAAYASATPVTRIGQIEAAPGLRFCDRQGKMIDFSVHSFDHFHP